MSTEVGQALVSATMSDRTSRDWVEGDQSVEVVRLRLFDDGSVTWERA